MYCVVFAVFQHENNTHYRNGTNTLGIIFFCLTFGTVLGAMGKKAAPVTDFFKVIDEVRALGKP